MTIHEAKEYIKENFINVLEPDNYTKRRQINVNVAIQNKDYGKLSFVCPCCSSGTGKNGTGITTKDGVNFACWSCNTKGDIYAFLGKQRNLTDFKDQFKEACKLFNFNYDELEKDSTEAILQYNERQEQEPATPEQEKDYTLFYYNCKEDLEKTTYYRGISKETLLKFDIGYCENWKPENNPHAKATPRLIIPTSKSSYLARLTKENPAEYEKRYSKIKQGKQHIFNIKSLEEAQNKIIIVEGEIDALSLIDCGADALALGSINNVDIFKHELEQRKNIEKEFIIALDNDKATNDNVLKAEDKLKAVLEQFNLKYAVYNVSGDCKDANELLQADKEQLISIVNYINNSSLEDIALNEKERQINDIKQELERNTAKSYLDIFVNSIKSKERNNFISTGFMNIDKKLEGGLFAGLYIIGAVSSLGKTSLVLQLADQLAEHGEIVLFYSLEMAKDELIAKSISRLTFLDDPEHNGSNAKTSIGILNGQRYSNYNDTELNLINDSISYYSTFAKNLYIFEGVANIGVKEIRETVNKVILATGRKPIVIVDYIQILPAYDNESSYTDKMKNDKNIVELKRLSRDKGISIIGVSSFNRDNYEEPVNMASFKETGAIEYTSDVLIGLQLQGMDYQKDDSGKYEKDETRRKRIKDIIDKANTSEQIDIEFKILKNRRGQRTKAGDLKLRFFKKFNYFNEI